MGLTVDVLFPNPEISLGKVIGNIAMRGVMFAVCVSPENEMHRSMTVNVLQGEQQEHRNMPIDEAISLISRKYFSFVDKGIGVGGPPQQGFAPGGGPAAVSSSGDGGSRVGGGVGGGNRSSSGGVNQKSSALPPDVQRILDFLTEDRPMSIMEYDKLIRYLVTRREATLKEEYGSNIPAHLLVPPVGPNQDPALKSSQEEIQNRVMEILNKKQAAHKQAQKQQTKQQNLDPALQNAIDSLVTVGPNILSSLVSASAGGGGGASAPLAGGSSEAGGGGGGGGSQLDRFYANLQRGDAASSSSSRETGRRGGDWG